MSVYFVAYVSIFLAHVSILLNMLVYPFLYSWGAEKRGKGDRGRYCRAYRTQTLSIRLRNWVKSCTVCAQNVYAHGSLLQKKLLERMLPMVGIFPLSESEADGVIYANCN